MDVLKAMQRLSPCKSAASRSKRYPPMSKQNGAASWTNYRMVSGARWFRLRFTTKPTQPLKNTGLLTLANEDRSSRGPRNDHTARIGGGRVETRRRLIRELVYGPGTSRHDDLAGD